MRKIKKEAEMKRYKIFILLGVLFISACSQKEEVVVQEKSNKQQNINTQLKQSTLSTGDAVSKSYEESIKSALKKESCKSVVIKTKRAVKAQKKVVTPLLFIPEHIKKSTIQSVPR